jgi:hypothetical protein
VVVALIFATTSCREGDSLNSGLDLSIADFIAEPRSPGVTSRYVSLQTRSVDGGRIVLDLVVSEIDVPVSGVVIKLTYPDSFGKFVRCLDGDLFPPGSCFFSEPGPGAGEVFVGRVVQGGTPAPTVNGDQIALRLEFLIFGTGQGPIVIEAQNLGGSDASAVLDVDGNPIPVDWFSGTIVGI